jgi:hypothetical protein
MLFQVHLNFISAQHQTNETHQNVVCILISPNFSFLLSPPSPPPPPSSRLDSTRLAHLPKSCYATFLFITEPLTNLVIC